MNATGEKFRRMAVSAARSLKHHHPDIPIDLYTDVELEDPAFDRVYMLDDLGPRPRFEALRRCRFDKVILLDVDIVAVAPIYEVFDVLERFDMAMVLDQFRNGDAARRPWREDIPDAFPQYNAGLVAMRMSDLTRSFVERWEAGFVEHGAGVDQPVMREILWNESELRVAALPPEYNLMDYIRIDAMSEYHSAPRIIHSYMLKLDGAYTGKDGRESKDGNLEWIMGKHRWFHLQQLLHNDRSLHAAHAGETQHTPVKYDAVFKLRYASLRLIADMPRKFAFFFAFTKLVFPHPNVKFFV